MQTNKGIAITLDKLQFSFTDSNLDLNDLKLYLDSSNFTLTDTTSKLNNSFKIQKDIYYNNIHIATLNISSLYKSDSNSLSFTNKSLYLNRDLILSLYNQFSNLYTLRIKKLDIAIDTDINILKIYNRLLRKNNLLITKSYQGDYYGNEYKEMLYTRDVNQETKYIIDKKARFSKDVVKTIKPHLRLENKKHLLDSIEHNRYYIQDYLTNNDIDITKDHYRMELCIPISECFINSNNKVYYNDVDDTISSYTYNKAVKYCKDFLIDDDLFKDDKEYLKNKMIIDTYKDSKVVRTAYSINIEQLLNDRDYLFNIYYLYSDKIIMNIQDIVNVDYNYIKINSDDMATTKRLKSDKDNKDDINILALSQLLKRGIIDKSVYDSAMIKINNSTTDNYNNDNREIWI